MSPVVDVRASIAAYLLDQVGPLVSGRVFRPDLPQAQERQMPRACLVIRAAGGYARYGRSTLQLGDPRVDVLCYGSTRLESDNIGDAVLLALKNLQSESWESAYLHSAQISGVIPLVDPISAWPFTLVSATVTCSEVSLA